jgi:hypothetical protein
METTFKLETIRILRKAKRPLHIKEIIKEILAEGNVRTRGATPRATLQAILIKDIKKNGVKSVFIKTEKGFFALNGKFAKKS